MSDETKKTPPAREVDPKVAKLVEWIVMNAWTESRLLYPDPAQHVEATSLLDTIVEVFGMNKDEMVRLVETANDEREKKARKR